MHHVGLALRRRSRRAMVEERLWECENNKSEAGANPSAPAARGAEICPNLIQQRGGMNVRRSHSRLLPCHHPDRRRAEGVKRHSAAGPLRRANDRGIWRG